MTDFPNTIDLQLRNPIYVGSVQKLYEVPGHPDFIISETSSGGSVFDVGTIFSIEGSDIGRASFRHLVFQQLQNGDAWTALSQSIRETSSLLQKDRSGTIEKVLSDFCSAGAPTHHAGMVERESGRVFSSGFPEKLSNLTLVRKFTVVKPELRRVLGWHFYDYQKYHSIDGNVIPLEYIVRLGITSGSSILRKYNRLSDAEKKRYLSDLGVDSLNRWSRFDPPIVDLTTKYEPEDRNLSRQEAALISSVDGDTFARSMAMAALGGYLLQQIFSKMGLSLWDMKWEIARSGNALFFVDTIDTDSVRVTYNISDNGRTYFVHFNKQAMRDYYKLLHSDWLDAVNDAKKRAAQSGSPFTEILAEGQKNGTYAENPVIDKTFLDIQTAKFEMIQAFIRDQSRDMSADAEKIARDEIEYYRSAGKIEGYEALNAG